MLQALLAKDSLRVPDTPFLYRHSIPVRPARIAEELGEVLELYRKLACILVKWDLDFRIEREVRRLAQTL